MSLVLLSDQVRHAPAHWTALIEHRDTSTPGRVVLTRNPSTGSPRRLLAPLPTPDTVADIARHLTALVDSESARPTRVTPSRAHSLGELVSSGRSDSGGLVRWNTRVGTATPAAMPIGLADSVPIVVDLGFDRGVVVSGTSLDDATAVVRTLLASMATAWSPHELAIVSVDHRAAPRPDPIRELSHDAGTYSDRGARAGRQLTSRLATELLAPAPSARRVAVVVYGPAQTEAAAPGLVEALARLAAAAGGIHLIVATDEPIGALDPALRSACSVQVTVDHVDGQRRATVLQDRLRTPFTPFEPAITAAAAIEVTPRVFGRELTALERHVARNGIGGDAETRTDREFQRLVDDLNDRAHAAALRPLSTLVPRPLPERVSAAAMLAAPEGDGVPLGLVARAGGHVPYNWRPDSSLVILGAATSAVSSLLDVVLVGLVERFGEVPLHVVDADAERRAAVRTSARGVVAPGDIAAVHALLDRIEHRSAAAPTPVVVVRDFAALRAADRERLGAMISRSEVHVVATATETGAVAELRGSPVRFVVGELDDHAGYAAVGITDSSDLTGRPGRCLLGREQLLMQVAELGDGLATALTEVQPARASDVPAGLAPPRAVRR